MAAFLDFGKNFEGVFSDDDPLSGIKCWAAVSRNNVPESTNLQSVSRSHARARFAIEMNENEKYFFDSRRALLLNRSISQPVSG